MALFKTTTWCLLVAVYNWEHQQPLSLFPQKCMWKNEVNQLISENRKEHNAFCGTPQYYYINYPKQIIPALSLVSKNVNLDMIGKFKLDQRFGRYHWMAAPA